jgi:hypothetical protein
MLYLIGIYLIQDQIKKIYPFLKSNNDFEPQEFSGNCFCFVH